MCVAAKGRHPAGIIGLQFVKLNEAPRSWLDVTNLPPLSSLAGLLQRAEVPGSTADCARGG